MPEQQVLWTALPRQASATELVLDVFVAPRLGIDAAKDRYSLADFPEFERWTATLADRLSFSVEFADGSVQAAQVVPHALDDRAWDHIFRPTTFVRPWSFKDLSGLLIYSFPLRFVTAYLRDLYKQVGHAHPTAPPTAGDLDDLVRDLGGVTDQRVPEEYRPPPRLPDDLPDPPPGVESGPQTDGEGCLTWLCRPLCRLLDPLRIRVGLPPLCRPRSTWPPPDPTKPKSRIPRVVHPSPYGPLAPIPPAQQPKRVQLEAQMQADKVIRPLPKAGAMKDALLGRDPGFDFTRVMRFYERPESKPPPGGHALPRVPELDFHQALGALGDYPALLRSLGLIVRLRVPRPAGAPGSVRVLAAWDGSTRSSDVSPRTRCVLDGDRFVAQSRKDGAPAGEPGPESDLDRGVLDLNDAGDRLATDAPPFDVIQVDSDGAAIKAVLQAASLERARQHGEAGTLGHSLSPAEPTPALRSGGLAIVRPDRAAQVHDRLVLAKDQSLVAAPVGGEPATLPKDLYAEDLVRGYRIEVSTDGGASWRSLHRRVGRYELVDDAGVVVDTLPEVVDEGYLKATSATSNGGETDPLYLHEAIARWTGWSLSVQRPGRTLEPDTRPPELRDPNDRYEQPKLPSSDPTQTEFRFATSFTPQAGSLPRLRFGGRYRLRALCVDLSGELLEQPPPGAPSSDEVTYRRFEPAGPPAPLPLRPFAPGESLERLVVRSDYDRDGSTWEDEEMSGTPADARARRTRHLFPPKTSQQLVELHGKLDHAPFKAFGPGADPDAGYRLSLRESGTFRDQRIYDVHTVDVDAPTATIPFGTPELVTPPDRPAGDAPPPSPNDAGAYVINRQDATLAMPYLPDPAVAGVALRGVPGLVDHVDGDPLPVIDVATGQAAGQTEPLLQVPFDGTWPDVRPLRVRVADTPGGGPAAPRWDASARVLTVFLRKAERAEVRYSSYVGAGELDRHGIWDWLDDDPPTQLREQAQAGAHWMISPPRTLVLVHAVQRPLETAHFATLDSNRQLGQTSAELSGKLKLDVASTGRIDVIGTWQEWRDPVDGEPFGKNFDEHSAIACDFAVHTNWGDDFPPPPPNPGDDVRARHQFGDTKHRRVHYRVRATTRFREYLDPQIGPKRIWRDSRPAEIRVVSIKSSARPDPPRVLYAVPTFGWRPGTPAPGWATHTSERSGGGLRVYLDGHWYSSGEGELLGIVLQTNQSTPLPEHLRTRYGADLIWRGADPPATTELQPVHFPNRTDTETGVVLAEKDGLEGTVVGFAPQWDATRKLWFCDIELDTAALAWDYWPFVRFAFARYQPEALPKAKLSPIVTGEFGQIAPDRTLSLSWQGNQRVTVTLSGRAPVTPANPRVALRIQTTVPGAPAEPDELDWEHTSGHAPNVDVQNFHTLVNCLDPSVADLTWTAQVDLPAPRGSQRMRLEIAEYELLATDETLGSTVPRITYAAHVPLD